MTKNDMKTCILALKTAIAWEQSLLECTVARRDIRIIEQRLARFLRTLERLEPLA